MGAHNCWEAMDCGRGPGGDKIDELGVCPAATATCLDGVHDGVNGGRACWGVVGTYCDGLVQVSLAEKLSYCVGCSFRASVESDAQELLSPQEIARQAGCG